MDKIKIDLEYCYGIKKLKTDIDFTNSNVICIYAPNGLMKTSLAKTFSDISKKKKTLDRIWPDNKTKRNVTDESDNDIRPEAVFVIDSYNEKYRSDRISTLLVNEDLRNQYEDIHKKIDEQVSLLVEELKLLSGLKKEELIKAEFSDSFTHEKNQFFQSLSRIKDEVEKETGTPLVQVNYSHIFNEKVKKVIEKPHIKNHIKDYIEQYNELLDKSNFFKKGVFTHDNASTIAKNLKENGFFEAEHSVFLRIDGEKKEISSTQDLESSIEKEKDRILKDETLRKAFEKINKELIKNKELKQFRECLENNPVVLAKLLNLDGLKQQLWKEYLIKFKDQSLELLSSYNKAKKEIDKIIKKAKKERTKWSQVISIFNSRFSVPFIVKLGNQEDVILKKDVPQIQFDFEDEYGGKPAKKPIEENTLIEILSGGEKKALYILNIIFEVEARKSLNQKTLFIIDDIADSFDYKNKYAIIEYLNEIKENGKSKQIILTHNFDFYRTVSKRLSIQEQNIMLADRQKNEIIFEHNQNLNPFLEWKNNLNDKSSLIASIPFIRNLAEYSGDRDSKKSLTSLLHIKQDTGNFKISDLEDIIKKILKDKDALSLTDKDTTVKETIYEKANKISADSSEHTELKDKIVLSIAIRLQAEEFMIAKIDDDNFVKSIKFNQTIQLIKRFKKDFPKDESTKILEEVNLMTPENIHLNSFMYEPIIDLSSHRLKELYKKVCNL